VRIGFYHGHLPQPGRKPGGVQVFVDRLAAALQRHGHEVTVFTYAAPDGPRPYRIRLLGPSRAATSTVVRQYVAPWLLNARPFTSEFDVAHLHGDDWFFLRRRLPTVRTFYGAAIFEAATATSLRRRVDSSIVYVLEQLAAHRADAVYGIGPDSRALFRADGVLSCGVGEPGPSQNGAQRSPHPVILFVGTWDGRKRGRMLRDAFVESVVPSVPGAELWMVSDFAQEGPGVRWFHNPGDAELADLYRRAWTFCLPSSYEGLGLPYIEAMAHGLPVVATPNPGAVDVLCGGRYGVVTNEDQLGNTLARSLIDDGLRAQMTTASRERAAMYAWPVLIEQYERAYALAIDRFRARRTRTPSTSRVDRKSYGSPAETER
jgi:glycosyltransferase involved in cell wall biosynthesis